MLNIKFNDFSTNWQIMDGKCSRPISLFCWKLHINVAAQKANLNLIELCAINSFWIEQQTVKKQSNRNYNDMAMKVVLFNIIWNIIKKRKQKKQNKYNNKNNENRLLEKWKTMDFPIGITIHSGVQK